MRKGCSVFYTHAHRRHTFWANVSLMHGHAVARGLIGYINTNISLEREEEKGYFVHREAQYFNLNKKLIIF